MIKLFKKFKRTFNPGSIFAYTKGIYIGKFAVLVDYSDSEEAYFLILPDMLPHSIKKTEFLASYRTNIIDYIEVLPNDIFEVVKAQYLKNIHAE